MNKILFFLIFLFAGITVNAQVASGSDFSFKAGKFYQNGTVIAPEQLPSVLGQQTYDDLYKPAKGMRTTGIVLLSAGGAITVAGVGGFVALLSDADRQSSIGGVLGDSIMAVVPACAALVGAVITASGGILLGVGNKKMKNIRPASSGAGLALVF